MDNASLPRPNTDNRDAWSAYWKIQGSPWRTEPEIDESRQAELAKYRSTIPDIKSGLYPFKNIKLSRADVEWLLATHKNGNGFSKGGGYIYHKGEGLDLRGADLCSVDLQGLPLACICAGLSRSEAIEATLEQCHMAKIHLEGANLSFAHLESAYLSFAHLEGANLFHTHLEGTDLYFAHLENAYLKEAFLQGASLRGCFFNSATNLNEAVFIDNKFGSVLLADVHWDDANLTRVDWEHVTRLGDESEARSPRRWDGKMKTKDETIFFYQTAVRANRQLVAVLEAKGMNEVAANFAYRAHLLERKTLWEKRRFARYLFSLFLNLVSGYGYRLWRSLATYIFVIATFAITYYFISPAARIPITPLEATVFSMTSFHGRGFSPGENIGLNNPLTVLAALEAFVGLIIEITLIATLTQRFFKK